jgi:hypothetical protein
VRCSMGLICRTREQPPGSRGVVVCRTERGFMLGLLSDLAFFAFLISLGYAMERSWLRFQDHRRRNR